MPKKTDATTNPQELKDLVIKFCQERHWEQHHSPKNLAMGIAIEAAELMEHYQWDQPVDLREVSDELADVLFNLLNLAQRENIDVAASFMKKYQKILAKYPLEKFNEQRSDLDEYRRIKQIYRGKKDRNE
jgi:dCTP diphosphatase